MDKHPAGTDVKQAIKELIRQLHKGRRPEELQEQFQALLSSITPSQIALVEQELIQEGIPREQIVRLCDLHLAVFQRALDKEGMIAPAGHPVHILMAEHQMLAGFAQQLVEHCLPAEKGDLRAKIATIEGLIPHFKESSSHYFREENVLFPYLERHGITEPPAIMWTEHDKIRAIKKDLYKIWDARDGSDPSGLLVRLAPVARSLAQMLSSHFYKENHVLFPTALEVISAAEWTQIRQQFDELGYCCFTPGPAMVTMTQVPTPVSLEGAGDRVNLQTGSLSVSELESMLNSLPFDITFVDADDTVRYFSQSKDRIFLRTKAVIGRKVQQCHPQKSIHLVNRILDEFRNGTRDKAEFWIDMSGRVVYIRYLAVRDGSGRYLGCVEVTQDITEIKRIEGQKRLL